MKRPKGRPEGGFVWGYSIIRPTVNLAEVRTEVDRLDLVVDKLSDVPRQVVVPGRRRREVLRLPQSVSTHPSISGVSLNNWLITLIL